MIFFYSGKSKYVAQKIAIFKSKRKKKHGKSFVIWTPNLYLLAFFRFAKFNFCHINFCHSSRKGCCICWFSPWALLWLSLSKHHFQYTQGTFCHNGKKGFPFGFFWKIGKRFTHQIREKINSQHVHFSPGGKSGFLLFFLYAFSKSCKKWGQEVVAL